MSTTRKDRDQIIPDRRIEAALDTDRRESVAAVRELITEAYNRGLSAGRMKSAFEQKRGTW